MNAWLCCGCRLCEYACVMGLQPWKLNTMLKGNLGAKGIRNSLHDKPEHAAQFREYKRYPVHKLINQLGISSYDVPAPMMGHSVEYKSVTLLLRQGVGAPAQPVVKVGDSVERGDLVAAIPEGKLSSNLHSSITGKVTAVTDSSITIQQ